MNNFNYELDQIERQILTILGQTGLPIGVIYLLLNKMTQDVQHTYATQIQFEAQAVAAEQQNEHSEEMPNMSAEYAGSELVE
jgi:hypothetical protein